MPPPALTGAPFLWLGVPLAVVYTLLLLGAIVVSGMATFMFARALGLSALPSAISALLFAFCQYRLDHYSHLELQMTMWMPLTLLAALRLLATGRRRYFIYLMLAAGAQWGPIDVLRRLSRRFTPVCSSASSRWCGVRPCGDPPPPQRP